MPPRFCADAAWLNWQQPLLHTGAGHLYQAPTVQLMRVTLHKAQGLQNLHVDPLAAAAAAAAMGRMAAPNSSPSRADRAKAVAERAMLGEQRDTWVHACIGRGAMQGCRSGAHEGSAPSLFLVFRGGWGASARHDSADASYAIMLCALQISKADSA